MFIYIVIYTSILLRKYVWLNYLFFPPPTSLWIVLAVSQRLEKCAFKTELSWILQSTLKALQREPSTGLHGGALAPCVGWATGQHPDWRDRQRSMANLLFLAELSESLLMYTSLVYICPLKESNHTHDTYSHISQVHVHFCNERGGGAVTARKSLTMRHQHTIQNDSSKDTQ